MAHKLLACQALGCIRKRSGGYECLGRCEVAVFGIAPSVDEHTDSLTGNHTLWTSSDPLAPRDLCDRQGRVVLAQCKLCGARELGLRWPCQPRENPLLVDVL